MIFAMAGSSKNAGCEKLPDALRKQCEKKQGEGEDSKKEESKTAGCEKLPDALRTQCEKKQKGGDKDDKDKEASLAERVAARYTGDLPSMTERLVSRHVAAKIARGKYDGKLVGKDCRLQWSDAQWLLEELPQKGKKKLRVAAMQNPYWNLKLGPLMPQNILKFDAKVSSSDSYDKMKEKIQKGMESVVAKILEEHPQVKWIKDSTRWSENQVYFLEVIPEDVDPFQAKGKDFVVHVAWGDFEALSPSSDMGSHDPSYTKVVQKSKGAARKLYQTLKADPTALSGTTWNKFTDWLTSKKIGYEYRFSVWR